MSLPPLSGGAPSVPGIDPEPYEPTAEDLASYSEWLSTIDDGLPVPDITPSCYTIEEHEYIRRGQVTRDELAMQAAGLPVG